MSFSSFGLFTDRRRESEQHHGQQYHAEQSSDDFNGEHVMAFHVGQKVVKIRMTGNTIQIAPALIIGRIYTIRDIDLRAMAIHGVATIRLEECIGPINNSTIGLWEAGYDPRGFRPLVERKTSIEIFTAMLTPKKQGVDA